MLDRHLCLAILVLLLVTPATSARADVFSMPLGQASVTLATVGDVGNAADATSYGAVGYKYLIDKFDVTAAQYTEFLNSVAKTDTYSLYNPNMASGFAAC